MASLSISPAAQTKNLAILWFFSPSCSISNPEANPDLYATKTYLRCASFSVSAAIIPSVCDTVFSPALLQEVQAHSPFLTHIIQSPHRCPSSPFKCKSNCVISLLNALPLLPILLGTWNSLSEMYTSSPHLWLYFFPLFLSTPPQPNGLLKFLKHAELVAALGHLP